MVVYMSLSDAELQLLRQTLLIFLQDMHVRVSLFLRAKSQNPNGRFVLPRSGPVPHGTAVPGEIRMLDRRGREVKRIHFPSGGSYSSPVREGSVSLHGDRVTRLGTNMYCESQPENTHTHTPRSAAAAAAAAAEDRSSAPNPLASEELNLLARLIGAVEVLERPGATDTSSSFRVNLLFTLDPQAEAEEEEAATPGSRRAGRIAEEFAVRDLGTSGLRDTTEGPAAPGGTTSSLMDTC
ncbi:hypothetical protein CRUP_019942 [Coryphaenoides rupestris]|nr:hypothetical protein CRUP_019942 [Coryphaenoides rupestris]